MITFAPVRVDDEMLRRYEALFFTCFSEADKFRPRVLKWLYADNPDGQVVGFDAFDGERLAAHYVCVPAFIRVNGVVVRSLLSLNTATHPDYQGKGLFSRLAELTYSAAAEQGFHSVYGVANGNSTPGFVRKLGFQLVQPLEAMVGVGSLGIDFGRVSNRAQFERVWTSESLRWRCANPANPVAGHCAGGLTRFHTKAMGALLPAYAELPGCLSLEGVEHRRPLSPLRLYLGLVPEGAARFNSYVSIPQRFRPSPLNLIFRALADPGQRLEAGSIHFSFLDFDAY